MEEAPLDELLLLALSLLCQETGRASVRRWWTVQRRFLCHRRFLTNFLMDLQEEEEEEEAEEEEYPDIMDSQWQILLSIIGITADVPCVDRCFWCRVTSTDWWDHIVMQTWDDQHWVQYFHMKKATFLELCEQLTPILQRKETHMRSPLPVQKRVAITVWKLATPDCYRLKSRWRCLQTRLDVSVINAVRITVACCALHNLCEARGEPFSPEWTSDSKGTQDRYPQPESAAITAGADCTWAANVRDALCAYIMDLHGPMEEGK
ncbi:uncharacterized protein LOC144267673 isoform X1 [Eretmochelys imbricata]